MTNKKSTKIAAIIALVAIFGSVIWTGVLVLVQTITWWTPQQETMTQEQLSELLKTYSGSLSGTGELNTLSGETIVLTWTTK